MGSVTTGRFPMNPPIASTGAPVAMISGAACLAFMVAARKRVAPGIRPQEIRQRRVGLGVSALPAAGLGHGLQCRYGPGALDVREGGFAGPEGGGGEQRQQAERRRALSRPWDVARAPGPGRPP